MKKLFTLFAFLVCFLGAKAEVVKVYEIDYSAYNGFPFYVMGYVPEWVDGIMTDYGSMYSYKSDADLADTDNVVGTVTTNNGAATYNKVQLESAGWHQYFIADNIPTEIGEGYHVKALVKSSESVSINVNMGWGWGDGQQTGTSVSIPQSDDFVEVEWDYTEIGGTSCNLVAQPGGATAIIEWKSLVVTQDKKESKPVTWQQWITSDGNSIIPGQEATGKYVGDAETAWPAWSLELTDGVNINWRTDKAPLICAWGLTMGKNNDSGMRDGTALDGRARPFPADIEVEEGTNNHMYAVHVEQIGIIDDDNSIQWSNQFWIQAPKAFKAGESVRIKFRYKAQSACDVATQWHKMNPSDYNNYTGVGTLGFTTVWQEFNKIVNIDTDNTWSLAFNLTSSSTKDSPQAPNIFYFDDLSWETMVLDEGLFVAGSNSNTGLEYDFDNAIEFVEDTDPDANEGDLVAIVGTVGDQNSWVKQVMISTVRGNDQSFKANTLKKGADKLESGAWIGYTTGSNAKWDLPAAGVWKIQVGPSDKQICFTQLEGEAAAEPVAIVTNTEEFVVNATERDWRGTDNDGNPIEAEVGSGQPWDNQFWIAANRDLSTGEVTVLKFKYKANKAARTSTQAHKVGDDGKPCTYLNWQAIGDVNFTEDWQDFSTDFTIPSGDDGMRSVVFNMAEIKEACDYYIKDVQWYVKDEALEAEGKTMENLINATGRDNFWIKVNCGQPESAAAGIESVVFNKTVSNVTYNLAGQRVSKAYKGIVINNGKKAVIK